jgi:hypothetical protein
MADENFNFSVIEILLGKGRYMACFHGNKSPQEWPCFPLAKEVERY